MAEEKKRFDQLICGAISRLLDEVFSDDEFSEDTRKANFKTLEQYCKMLEEADYKIEHMQNAIGMLESINYGCVVTEPEQRMLESCIYRLQKRIESIKRAEI